MNILNYSYDTGYKTIVSYNNNYLITYDFGFGDFFNNQGLPKAADRIVSEKTSYGIYDSIISYSYKGISLYQKLNPNSRIEAHRILTQTLFDVFDSG